MYSQAQIDAIFQHILGTGLLDDIEFDEQVAASIGSQLQRKMATPVNLKFTKTKQLSL